MKNLEKNLSTDKNAVEEAQKIIENAQKSKHSKRKKDSSLPVPKNKSKKLLSIVIISVITLILLILSVIFGIITSKSNKIISGVSVNGIDISSLTKEQALEKLTSDNSLNSSKEITLTHENYSKKIELSSIDANLNLAATVDEAYNLGRSESNIFANNFKVISVFFTQKNISPVLRYNSDLLNEIIENINSELPDKVIEANYKIDGNNLIIANSHSGNKVQNDILKANIENAITNNINTIEIPVEMCEAKSVDIEAIYKEIYKEAKDATFTKNPYEIHKEETGLDFAITLDEAKKIVSQNQESFTIPLKVTKPKVTTSNLPQEAFPDLLATYSTTYATSNRNRSTNIALAAKSVNGLILMPGETFSYNSTVGQRTAARGYKEAGVYLNGEVTTGLGGGICQVSSTLYNAVLLSNLEIVERTNHTFKPTYVPAGQDATVSWGAPDFKFKNNRNYPIKLTAITSNGKITFNIYGLKTSDDYEVKIQSSVVGSIPFSTQYQDDPTLPVGTTKVKESGSNGCKTQTYKVLYKNGKQVSRTLINSDTYKPHNQVILKGTKIVEEPVIAPTPEPTTPTIPTTLETPSTSEQPTVQEEQPNTQNPTPSVTVTTNQPAE